jgi:hypothetical protein
LEGDSDHERDRDGRHQHEPPPAVPALGMVEPHRAEQAGRLRRLVMRAGLQARGDRDIGPFLGRDGAGIRVRGVCGSGFRRAGGGQPRGDA